MKERIVAKVSVVIPAYNAALYIADAVRSVQAQSFTDVELIVVDDGSRDETAGIVEAMPGVTCIRKPNGGVSSARNTGVRHATGELIAFLDADDVWHRDKLAAQVALLDRYADSDLCYTRVSDDLDDYRARFEARALPFEAGLPAHSRVESLAPSFRMPYFGTSSVMVRRSAFDAVAGFDETLPYAEDVDFYLKVLIRRPAIPVVEFPAVYKRPVPGSLGDDSVAGYGMLLRVYALVLQTHPELERRFPGMVRDARANLYLRQSASLLRTGARGPAFAAALRSLRWRPGLKPLALAAAACMPSALKRAARALKRRFKPA